MLSGHSDHVTSISSGIVDGSGRKLLASGSEDKTIRLWDAVTGECVRVLEGHSVGVRCVTGGFVDDSGRYCIASTGSDGTLRVWDMSTDAAVSVLSNEEMGFRGVVRCVSIVHCKCRLAVAGAFKPVIIDQLTLAPAAATPEAARRSVK